MPLVPLTTGAFTLRTSFTKVFTHRRYAHTQRSICYTNILLPREGSTNSMYLCTRNLLRTGVLTQRCTQNLLQTENYYTQMLLHTDHGRLFLKAQAPLHTRPVTDHTHKLLGALGKINLRHRCLYTQKPLHDY